MLPPINELLFEIEHTLLNAVTHQLRAVTVDIDTANKKLFFAFFYDGEVTDELFDLASIAIAEVDLTGYTTARDDIVRLDYPQEIPIQGRLAFLRKEPTLPNYKKENRTCFLTQVPPNVILLLDLQEALLGKVTPALRLAAGGVNAEHKRLEFYFIYDGPISEEDFNLASSAIREASTSFPDYEIVSQIERIDYPNEFTSHGYRAAYLRKE